MDPEEACVINKLLPYSRDQALELSQEVVKLLSKDTAFKEDFDLDEEPQPQKKSSVESWLSAVSNNPSQTASWMNVSLEICGCLVRKAKAEVKFSSKKGFSTQLAGDPSPGWVIEQAISARNEAERACRALNATFMLDRNQPSYLLELCERLDEALTSLSRARNALLFPNSLGFPRALRPFNGFIPPLSEEFLLDFSIFRDRLVVSAFRVVRQSTDNQPPYQAVLPDRWFDDPPPPYAPRLVGTTIAFDSGVTVKILEQHSVSFQVALMTKIQVFLSDAHRVLRDLSMNVVACLSVRPDYFLSSQRRMHSKGEANNENDDEEDTASRSSEEDSEGDLPLIQPSRTKYPEAGKRWI